MDDHKTVLRIKTGDEGEINNSLGRVITALASPAVLADIDRQSLTPSQIWHLERFDGFWVIDSYWFTALHTRQVDVKQYPFIQPAFQDRRAFSELIKAQLDLCAGVFEACDMQGFYPTHYDWFIACINERQQAQVNKILLQPDEESILNKGEKEDGLRKFVQKLKKRQVPLEKSLQNQHLYRLYHSSILLLDPGINSNARQFNEKFWQPYLKAFQSYIRSIKENPHIKAVFPRNGGLCYQDRKARISIPLKPQQRQWLKPLPYKHSVDYRAGG